LLSLRLKCGELIEMFWARATEDKMKKKSIEMVWACAIEVNN